LNDMGMEPNMAGRGVRTKNRQIRALLKVNKNITVDQIAYQMGCHPNSIRSFMERHRLKRHTKREERAYLACGHHDWRKCGYCKHYDSLKNLITYGYSQYWHRECFNKKCRDYQREQRLVKKYNLKV